MRWLASSSPAPPTGSALAVERLVAEGHEVALHARSRERARDAARAVPGARAVLVGDLSSLADTRALAEQANRAGPLDAVIHNAGVGLQERRIETVDGLEQVFAINVLAPYLLTALVHRPRRLVWLSSGMHRGGAPDLGDLQWLRRRWGRRDIRNWSGRGELRARSGFGQDACGPPPYVLPVTPTCARGGRTCTCT